MGHGHGWLVERLGRFYGRHDPLQLGVRRADQGVVSSIKGLLLGVFFIAIGMSINLREVSGIGGELLHYLPSLLLLKMALGIALGLSFRLGFRASVLVGLLLAPFDEIAYVIFTSAHGSGLLTDRAYAMGLTGSRSPLLFRPC